MKRLFFLNNKIALGLGRSATSQINGERNDNTIIKQKKNSSVCHEFFHEQNEKWTEKKELKIYWFECFCIEKVK